MFLCACVGAEEDGVLSLVDSMAEDAMTQPLVDAEAQANEHTTPGTKPPSPQAEEIVPTMEDEAKPDDMQLPNDDVELQSRQHTGLETKPPSFQEKETRSAGLGADVCLKVDQQAISAPIDRKIVLPAVAAVLRDAEAWAKKEKELRRWYDTITESKDGCEEKVDRFEEKVDSEERECATKKDETKMIDEKFFTAALGKMNEKERSDAAKAKRDRDGAAAAKIALKEATDILAFLDIQSDLADVQKNLADFQRQIGQVTINLPNEIHIGQGVHQNTIGEIEECKETESACEEIKAIKDTGSAFDDTENNKETEGNCIVETNEKMRQNEGQEEIAKVKENKAENCPPSGANQHTRPVPADDDAKQPPLPPIAMSHDDVMAVVGEAMSWSNREEELKQWYKEEVGDDWNDDGEEKVEPEEEEITIEDKKRQWSEGSSAAKDALKDATELLAMFEVVGNLADVRRYLDESGASIMPDIYVR